MKNVKNTYLDEINATLNAFTAFSSQIMRSYSTEQMNQIIAKGLKCDINVR